VRSWIMQSLVFRVPHLQSFPHRLSESQHSNRVALSRQLWSVLEIQ
jgi:hypothetical protein